jgi:flagellar hook-associated protein 1 FlgK
LPGAAFSGEGREKTVRSETNVRALSWRAHAFGNAPAFTPNGIEEQTMQVTTATSDALQKYLDLASDQMKLTAENMANVDTPGYKYIGFDQTKTENNGLTLTTANGALLVSEGQSFALGTATAGGNVGVVSSTGNDITSSLTGGSLGGMLQARDQDLPQIASALDSLAYAIGSAVNTQNQAGLDTNGNPGGPIFTLPPTSTNAAATISVAAAGPNAIAAAAMGEGATGNTNATALNNLANTTLAGGQTAAQFYASMLTQLGSAVAAVSSENTTQQASLTQLITQQSSQSSVSLDQEAANLTLYERSYAAAAKVFTIVDQLMASALNLGEETTVA